MKAKKILVVDDETPTQEFFCDVLKSAGYDVLTAGTAVTAVKLVQVEEPDLVTLDINLSTDPSDDAWDGFRVLAWLRHLKTTKPPAIVVISGSPEPDKAMKKAREAGVQAYLAKPVEKELLLNAVAEALTSNSPP